MQPAASHDGRVVSIGEVARRATGIGVPEQEEQALVSTIQARLSDLPRAIADDDTLRRAKESLPVLKRAEDSVVEFFRPMKQAAHAAHKAITSREAERLAPIAAARQSLSRLIYSYEQEQQRVRRELERKAAEEERARLEQQALEEAAAIAADQPEMAEQIVEQAIAAPAPVVILPAADVAVAGVSSRENWTWTYANCGSKPDGSPRRWKDLTDTERQSLMRLIPREYLQPDEAAIGRIVKALKGGTKIPGIASVDIGSVAVRG